jgi:2-polyprenyl-3-methyl-5-hydroxy-6-metoxy-1,4-benzoquinol methylase
MIANFNLDKNAKVLNIGCGNSEFCEAMYDDGYTNIINIDICENVIRYMKERNTNRTGLVCKYIFYNLSRNNGCERFKIRR